MFKKILLAALTVVCLSAGAAIVEIENNGSIPNAQNLNLSGAGSVQVTGSVVGNGNAGDYDYFRLGQIAVGGNVTISTAGSNFDTYIGIYNAAGSLLASDDDGGGGVASFLSFNVGLQDIYTLVIRGFGSGFAIDPFSLTPGNGRGAEGDYTARIDFRGIEGQSVPEPDSLVLIALALGALVVARRKRV